MSSSSSSESKSATSSSPNGGRGADSSNRGRGSPNGGRGTNNSSALLVPGLDSSSDRRPSSARSRGGRGPGASGAAAAADDAKGQSAEGSPAPDAGVNRIMEALEQLGRRMTALEQKSEQQARDPAAQISFAASRGRGVRRQEPPASGGQSAIHQALAAGAGLSASAAIAAGGSGRGGPGDGDDENDDGHDDAEDDNDDWGDDDGANVGGGGGGVMGTYMSNRSALRATDPLAEEIYKTYTNNGATTLREWCLMQYWSFGRNSHLYHECEVICNVVDELRDTVPLSHIAMERLLRRLSGLRQVDMGSDWAILQDYQLGHPGSVGIPFSALQEVLSTAEKRTRVTRKAQRSNRGSGRGGRGGRGGNARGGGQGGQGSRPQGAGGQAQ